MFKTLQHLLPNGRAWRTTVTEKNLTKLLKGLSAWAVGVRAAKGEGLRRVAHRAPAAAQARHFPISSARSRYTRFSTRKACN